MADPTPETADDQNEAPKKKSKVVPLLVMVVTAVGGYFAGTAVLAPRLLAGGDTSAEVAEVADQGAPAEESGGHGAPTEGEGNQTPEGESHFMEIGNILVNPSDSRGLRFLMTTVAFELEDAGTRTLLRQREAQVRDVVISVLERLTLDQLSMVGSRDSIRIDIKAAVMDEFHLSFLNVFISQFVIN